MERLDPVAVDWLNTNLERRDSRPLK